MLTEHEDRFKIEKIWRFAESRQNFLKIDFKASKGCGGSIQM